MPKVKVEGWIEDETKPKTNVPKECPKCGGKLNKVNALSLCGWFFVYCMNKNNKGIMCRWCDIYGE
jgi:hypothetical protein